VDQRTKNVVGYFLVAAGFLSFQVVAIVRFGWLTTLLSLAIALVFVGGLLLVRKL
jgi:hypothetical protein